MLIHSFRRRAQLDRCPPLSEAARPPSAQGRRMSLDPPDQHRWPGSDLRGADGAPSDGPLSPGLASSSSPSSVSDTPRASRHREVPPSIAFTASAPPQKAGSGAVGLLAEPPGPLRTLGPPSAGFPLPSRIDPHYTQGKFRASLACLPGLSTPVPSWPSPLPPCCSCPRLALGASPAHIPSRSPLP